MDLHERQERGAERLTLGVEMTSDAELGSHAESLLGSDAEYAQSVDLEIKADADLTPHSSCSKICLPGYRKSPRKGAKSCCYDCIACPEGEISNQTDMESCTKCPESQWPNTNRDKCIYKVINYLSYEEPLGMLLASISVLFALFTSWITIIFTKYRTTPIVKANNRDLTYILLFSLKMCFLCNLIFIGHPLHITCILRQTVFGVTFSISVSAILAKTLTVVIAFNATKPGSKLKNWMGATVSNSVVIVSSMIQVIICACWLAIKPPFPYYNMKDEIGKIVAQCDEGSIIGFYCILGYMGFLALASFTIAFFARELPDIFNEAKFISFSMLVFCSVWISFIPAYLSTKGKYVVAVEIFSILASSTGILGCIFVPKLYIILIRPERNTKLFITRKDAIDEVIGDVTSYVDDVINNVMCDVISHVIDDIM
ncbi:vomeronasal type-2 receptor 26-like [Bombina bombina]|uniref:vomeronasal type-2 receptor 26-like n=1 Tax=Bombina bombina TaxID=8345 RepID=UPI00235AD72E|nr:vomeronasal type-2 receptor 26-like [Bombina bombina]